MNDNEKKQNNQTEGIEILDFNEEKPVENTLEKRKDNRIIIISVAVLIAFMFLLPTITSLFNKNSNGNYTETVDNNTSTNLVNGFIQIDKTDGNMVVNDIKFYNFVKRTNNLIRYNYKANNPIKNVKSLSLFIEIYNKSEEIIYREQFIPTEEIEKGPVLSSSIELNPEIYKEAHYVKITKISNENLTADSSLTCKREFTDEEFFVNYTVKYNFGKNSLINYEVTKTATKETETSDADNENTETPENTEGTEGTTAETNDKYNDLFLKEEADISNTNTQNYKREDNYLNYVIDLTTLDLLDSEYKPLYKIGTVERTIKLIEESNGWSCTNE